MTLIAAGLDPDVCTLFVQSHVAEHSNLSWLLECTVSFGELRRMTQFKDKADRADFVSAGLFSYPALMAADILLYDTDWVPVGDDQRQHLEITRDIAVRFNSRYGDTFKIPEAAIPAAGARVMDLQSPTKKMSKSESSPQGTVDILEPLKDIERKVMRAVTDSDTEVRFDVAEKPGIANLLSILAACTGGEPAEIAKAYTQYGPLKKDTAAAVVETVRPIQARYAELASDPAEMARLLGKGATRPKPVKPRRAIGHTGPRLRRDRATPPRQGLSVRTGSVVVAGVEHRRVLEGNGPFVGVAVMLSRPRRRERMAAGQLEVVAADRRMVLVQRDASVQTTDVRP